MFLVKDTVFVNRQVSFEDGCLVAFQDQLALVPDHHIDFFREVIDYIVEKQESLDEVTNVVNNKEDGQKE